MMWRRKRYLFRAIFLMMVVVCGFLDFKKNLNLFLIYLFELKNSRWSVFFSYDCFPLGLIPHM